MPRYTRFLVSYFAVAAIFFVSPRAQAQSVTASGQVPPERFIGGQDVGVSTRPSNLTPLGVNYSDCVQDMTLRFSVQVSGFTGANNLQVWATRSGDCSADTTRGVGSVTGATCWLVNGGSTGLLQQSAGTLNFDVRVQDLIGPQNAPPFPTTLVSEHVTSTNNPCLAQPSFAAVPMNIWFVPTNSANQYTGSGAYNYPITTDMLGPPGPSGVSIADGDTLFVVNWTPNSDSDTQGYDVYLDPAADTVFHANADASASVTTETICPDAGVPALVNANVDAETGASDSGTAASSADAGCYTVNVANTPPSGAGTCPSTVLGPGGGVVDSGATVSTPVYDDAGNLIDSGIVTNTKGGLSTVPASYIVNANAGTGTTVSGLSGSTYTITGLTDGTTYTVGVAAVDGSGNVGPLGSVACDFPAPVNDFWKLYRQDGGQAGGGYCALEAVGAPVGSSLAVAGLGTVALAVARRRRRRV